MPKIELTTLTPLHISSGREFEINFNMLQNRDEIYIYDEFKIAEIFIENGIDIPSNFNELKKLIDTKKDLIISSNKQIRKIKSAFKNLNKPLKEHVSTSNSPIITGSSIKGAIRTAYINKMVREEVFKREAIELQRLDDEIYKTGEYRQKNKLKRDKKELIKKINEKINDKTKNIFKYLKISDTLKGFNNSAIYKTINIKKEKEHQENRSYKVENISNYVEVILPNEKNFITINLDNHFKNLPQICNDFYFQLYNDDFSYYFADSSLKEEFVLDDNTFLLNIGRFSGAELKSIKKIRSLAKTGADVEWETTTRTYALKEPKDNFENQLAPFGWILCKII